MKKRLARILREEGLLRSAGRWYGPKDFRRQKTRNPEARATARILRDRLQRIQNLLLPAIYPAGAGMGHIQFTYPGKDEALENWFEVANDLFKAMTDDSVSEAEAERLQDKLDDIERNLRRDYQKWSDDKYKEYRGVEPLAAFPLGD